MKKGLLAARMHRWTGTSSRPEPVSITIFASANRSEMEPGCDESLLKRVSRFSERRRRAEISGGGDGSEEEESVSDFVAATKQMLLPLLISFESEKPVLLSII